MIKHQRLKNGLTQLELADKLAIDKQYVSKLENGRINISANYLDRVIKELKSEPEDFLIINTNP